GLDLFLGYPIKEEHDLDVRKPFQPRDRALVEPGGIQLDHGSDLPPPVVDHLGPPAPDPAHRAHRRYPAHVAANRFSTPRTVSCLVVYQNGGRLARMKG